MSFFNFAAPALPLAAPQYDVRQQNELTRSLRLYFNRVDTFVPPHGSFYDTTDQTAASTTTAYAMTFNSTDISVGVGIASSSRITVSNSGTYNLQFSCQLSNTSNAPQDIDIWFRRNGTDIANSNTRFGLAARKSVGDPFHTVAALNFFITLKTSDYVQIMWCTTSTDAKIEYYSAPSSPTRPAIPSVIATIAWITA
jgi:hypothetical protein